MMIPNTNVRLPISPTVLPIIDINRFNVGHDLANLNTRSLKMNEINQVFFAGKNQTKNLPNEMIVILKGRKRKKD